MSNALQPGIETLASAKLLVDERENAFFSIRTIQFVSALLIALVILSPLVLLVVGSLKADRFVIAADFGSFRAFWVDDPTFKHYADVLSFEGSFGFARYLMNSLFILVATVGAGLVVNSMAGFVLAWGSLPGRTVMLSVVIALYVIPQESIVMPMLLVVTNMGLADTFSAQILPWVASPLYTFLFYQFFTQLPKELYEAASMDGASFFRVFRAVYLPLSLPAVATVSILMGIETWNQYLWPVLVSQTDYSRPISVAIASYFGVSEMYWDLAMASSVVMMTPVLILYVVFQRWFVSSFVGSAVKG